MNASHSGMICISMQGELDNHQYLSTKPALEYFVLPSFQGRVFYPLACSQIPCVHVCTQADFLYLVPVRHCTTTGNSPIIERKNVVLPAPFRPIRPIISPLSMDRPTSRRIGVPLISTSSAFHNNIKQTYFSFCGALCR